MCCHQRVMFSVRAVKAAGFNYTFPRCERWLTSSVIASMQSGVFSSLPNCSAPVPRTPHSPRLAFPPVVGSPEGHRTRVPHAVLRGNGQGVWRMHRARSGQD
eukprot:363097-Chlamydomonas_euryale.AAC.2